MVRLLDGGGGIMPVVSLWLEALDAEPLSILCRSFAPMMHFGPQKNCCDRVQLPPVVTVYNNPHRDLHNSKGLYKSTQILLYYWIIQKYRNYKFSQIFEKFSINFYCQSTEFLLSADAEDGC